MLRASVLTVPRFGRPSTWLTPSRRPVVGSIASGLYGQGILVITGVVVARSLGPTDRGHLAFILLLESIVRQVGLVGIPVATTYFIARNRDQAYDVLRAVRTPALVQVALLTLGQAVLLRIFIAGQPERVWLAGLLTLALIPSILGQEYGLAILQGQGRFTAFNIFRAIPVTGYGAIVVVLFATSGDGLITITIAYLIPNAALHRRAAVRRSSWRTADRPGRGRAFAAQDLRLRLPGLPRKPFADRDVPARSVGDRALSEREGPGPLRRCALVHEPAPRHGPERRVRSRTREPLNKRTSRAVGRCGASRSSSPS